MSGIPDWLANRAKTSGYGADAYQAINWALSQGDTFAGRQLSDNLSVYSLATSGTLDVSAAQVAFSLLEETVFDALEEVGEQVLESVMDVAGDIAGDVVGDMAGAVPIVGQAFKLIAAVVGGYVAEEEKRAAEAEAKAKQAEAQACARNIYERRIIPSGATGAKPCDYFVQSGIGKNSPLAPPGARYVGEFWTTDRAPFVGDVLVALTEGRFTHAQVASAYDRRLSLSQKTGFPGGNYDAAAVLFGARPAALEGWSLAAKGYAAQRAVVPWTKEFQPFFAQVRNGIIRQSFVREVEGLSGGDGGATLWPIYMDLLKYLLIDENSGFLHKSHGGSPGPTEPRPRIPYQYALTMFGFAPACGSLPGRATGWEAPGVDPADYAAHTLAGFGDPCAGTSQTEQAMCHARTATNYVEGSPFLPWCVANVSSYNGSGWNAVDQIYKMAIKWEYSTKPAYASDAKKLAGQLATVYAEAQARTDAKLGELRNKGRMTEKKLSAAQTLKLAVKTGIVNPKDAEAAGEIMSPGGVGDEPASALPWVLGAGAAVAAVAGASIFLKGQPWRR